MFSSKEGLWQSCVRIWTTFRLQFRLIFVMRISASRGKIPKINISNQRLYPCDVCNWVASMIHRLGTSIIIHFLLAVPFAWDAILIFIWLSGSFGDAYVIYYAGPRDESCLDNMTNKIKQKKSLVVYFR